MYLWCVSGMQVAKQLAGPGGSMVFSHLRRVGSTAGWGEVLGEEAANPCPSLWEHSELNDFLCF